LKAKELKRLYLEFFKEKSHAIIPSASLVPENDPTVLFTTAGMHPLVPYLLGQPHPLGKRIADVQKCLRTDDIDEVGDASHHTFFEMLGNWSLGDYFKDEAIKMSYEFLTSKKWLGMSPEKIYITVFAGDSDAPRDDESAKAWMSLGIAKERISYNPKKDNWWGPAGRTGPCGPDTEMFFDTGKQKCSPECRPGCGCGKYFEIWNDVFMQYNKTEEGKYELLKQKNVDTGMGLERTAAVLQGKDNDYETELFKPMMDKINELTGRSSYGKEETISTRIIADHLRAATFVLGDDAAITPSNVERGYVLRRLIRRAVRRGRLLGIKNNLCREIAEAVIGLYGADWPELEKNREFICSELDKEEERFNEKLDSGVKAFNKIFEENKEISGKNAFLLFQSYGLPIEITKELLKEKGSSMSASALGDFDEEFKKHQELSRLAMGKIFKSGLADNRAETVKLHTATHLLHAALKRVLGEHVKQKGSNITADRLRFDFSHDKKVTPEELKKVEDLVNEQISKQVKVLREEMTLEEALKSGATALFGEKYGQKVSIYTVGDFSKEVCAGPHVENTSQLGRFKIIKEEASAAGIRRIKAVFEKAE
jgi:alanyl-tRNA synthetase